MAAKKKAAKNRADPGESYTAAELARKKRQAEADAMIAAFQKRRAERRAAADPAGGRPRVYIVATADGHRIIAPKTHGHPGFAVRGLDKWGATVLGHEFCERRAAAGHASALMLLGPPDPANHGRRPIRGVQLYDADPNPKPVQFAGRKGKRAVPRKRKEQPA